MLQIPRLSNDILYLISEKLLFKNLNDDKRLHHEVDLTIQNNYTLFMFHSLGNMQAFISHFSKMIHLHLGNVYDNNCQIRFYSIKNKKYNESDFNGPYYVWKNFIFDLIDFGLLRISNLNISNFLGEVYKIKTVKDKNSDLLKYLLKNKESMNMNISKLEVREHAAIIRKHLTKLLSINAENIEFSCSGGFIFNCYSFERPLIIAEHVKKIVTKPDFESRYLTSFISNFKNYLQILLLSCTNLEYMEFEFYDQIRNYCYLKLHTRSDESFYIINLFTNLELFINSIVNHLKSLKHGSKNLKIRIEIQFTFNLDFFWLIPKEHKFFTTIGKPLYDGFLSDYYSHIIEVTDLIGRKHECLFKIERERYFEDSVYYDSSDLERRNGRYLTSEDTESLA